MTTPQPRPGSFPFVALACLLATAARLVAATEIAPLPPGPFPVASSHLEVDATKAASMLDYLNGADGWFTRARYIDQILADRTTAVVATVRLPDTEPFPAVCVVLYPTTADNPRPDYVFPYTNTGDNRLPHMQRRGEKPLLARPGQRWPLILSSPGYNDHPLWHIDHAKRLAAQGYIVADIFHGDGRWSFDECLRRRPAMLKQVLDQLLAHPDFGPAIDPERIGVAGSSLGGYTILNALGATLASGARSPWHDPRVKAGFGLVPFAGQERNGPFGEHFAGLATVDRPYLALYGEKDINVPPADVRAHTARCAGPAMAVQLGGEAHLLTAAAWNDVPTWEILFFNAWLKDDPAARAHLATDLRVTGGVDDRVTYRSPTPAVQPAPAAR